MHYAQGCHKPEAATHYRPRVPRHARAESGTLRVLRRRGQRGRAARAQHTAASRFCQRSRNFAVRTDEICLTHRALHAGCAPTRLECQTCAWKATTLAALACSAHACTVPK
jgi:hypothetical protein